MRRGRQSGRASTSATAASTGNSSDSGEQWEPQPSTSRAGVVAPDDEASSDGVGADYQLMSPRPSSAVYSPSGGYGSPSAGAGSEAEPHSDLLCPPDLQPMALSPLPGPSGAQDPMAQPVYQADTGGVLLRSPPADSYLVSSSTGPLDGHGADSSDAPPPTPGMSAMIDSTVDDPESVAAAPMEESETEDEPDDGISGGPAGNQLHLVDNSAPGPSGASVEPAPGPSDDRGLHSPPSDQHLVAEAVVVEPMDETYEADAGGSALVVYEYLDDLPADGRHPADLAGEPGPASAPTETRHRRPSEADQDSLRLEPDEREALRRERAESRLGSRRRPEPPLLRLARSNHHQQQQPQHQQQQQEQAELSDSPHRQLKVPPDDDLDEDPLLTDQRAALVPLPPDSDSDQEAADGGSQSPPLRLHMECDSDEPLLELHSGQQDLFEREADLSEMGSEDGVDGHAVILAGEAQYRLSETEEEGDSGDQPLTEERQTESEAAGSSGAAGIRPADLAQLPFIYLTDGLDIGLGSEGGSADPAGSHLLVQVPPAYERPQNAHQNDFWCEECCAYYRGRCPDHQVRLISDRPMQSRAWASLPTSHLAIRAVGNADEQQDETVYGVIAKKTIPKRTQFGPMEGILVRRDRGSLPPNPTGLVLSVDHSGQLHTVDVSNPDCSNWMRFVRRAETAEQQNLVLNQQGSHLFLTSSRVIAPREELRAGYSLPYAARRGLAMLVAKPEVTVEAGTSSGDGTPEDGSSSNDAGSAGKEEPDEASVQAEQHQVDDDHDDPDWPLTCEGCGRCFVNLSALEEHDCEHPQEEDEEGPEPEESSPQRLPPPPPQHPQPQSRIPARGRPPKNPRQPPKRAEANRQNADRWICQYCPLSFESASTLNLHTLAHAAEDLEDSAPTVDEPLHCPECNKEFVSRDELITHVASHGTEPERAPEEDVYIDPIDENRPYRCHPCGRSFTHEEWLKRHLQSHIPDEEKPLACGTCDRRFASVTALQCHRRVHSAAARRFQCPLCRAMFEQVTALRQHVRTHATNGKYICPHCEKTFDGYMTIRKHIRSFHNERVFVCSLCYKLCQSTDKLKQHMLKHSDHREFLCSECGKQFKRKDKLKEHIKRLHSVDRKPPPERKPRKKKKAPKEPQLQPKVPPTDYHRFIYKCHKCKLGFKRRGMLVNHLAKRHPGMGPEQVPELMLPILKTTKDFYCQYCYKTYKSSSKRKAHILKIHPGAELPVSCRGAARLPLGDSADQTSYSQTVGSVTMSPHACSWCHKQYASRAKLLQHQRSKHPDLMPTDSQKPRQTSRTSSRRAAARAELAAEMESSESEDAILSVAAEEPPAPTPASSAPVSLAAAVPVPVPVPLAGPVSVVAPAELHTAQPLLVQAAHPALIQEAGQLEQADLLGAGMELHSLDYRLCQPAGAAASGELCRVWTVHSTR
ncbi:PR domain zinc finger protein 10 [Amphibalanus amphitrite]|uniref:PR domain zinc finger protein 10 n=1 Tax=Amphibalanus amphitrite TaxID=1232801 RepID=A0A6A4VI89_AMPAM|nr:PR domain zinc finger protein 10 [Amphibalanus amphitrite]